MATELLTSHRAPKGGEWSLIPPDERNPHQQLAEISHGVLTIANAITVVGGLLVVDGIGDMKRGDHLEGILKIGAGRILDLVDGEVSDRLGTKGPVGEAMDAGVDSLLTFYAAYELWKLGILPDEFAALLAAQQGLNMAFTGIAKVRKKEIHTGASGKISQAQKWAAVGMYSISYTAENANRDDLTEKLCEYGQFELAEAVQSLDLLKIAGVSKLLAHAFAVGGIALGAFATSSYGNQAVFQR